jgi:ketosteroid isomerase-like protein
MSQENVEIVRQLYEAVARRDRDTVLSIYHPDVEWDHTHNLELAGLMGGQTVYNGHEGVRRWSREFYEAWDSVEADLVDLIDAGEDQVIVVLNYRCRGLASGAEVQFTRMAGVMTFRDRQIVKAEWFKERAAALEAAGVSE